MSQRAELIEKGFRQAARFSYERTANALLALLREAAVMRADRSGR